MAPISREDSNLFQFEDCEVDVFGFPVAKGSVDRVDFGESASWLESKGSSSPWFFDLADSTPVCVNAKKQEWDENDDRLLDMLLQDGHVPDTPKILRVTSFEDGWKPFKFENLAFDDFSTSTKSNRPGFCWDDAKMVIMTTSFEESHYSETHNDKVFDLGEISLVRDESRKSETSDDDSTVSALSVESMTFEDFFWVKSKIASMTVADDRSTDGEDELFETPDGYDGLTSRLLQVSPEELGRRFFVMQQRTALKAQLEHLSQSNNKELRQEAELRLKELWTSSYKKKANRRKSDL